MQAKCLAQRLECRNAQEMLAVPNSTFFFKKHLLLSLVWGQPLREGLGEGRVWLQVALCPAPARAGSRTDALPASALKPPTWHD